MCYSALFRLAPLLGLTVLLAAPRGQAAPGVFEINDTCATSQGCFPGDAAGYPITIAAPGSYRLTSNVGFAVASSQPSDLIEITSDEVTLDLAGFQITCRRFTPGEPCSGTTKGIVSSGRGITVMNGSVSGVASNGIQLGNDARVLDVTVHNTGGTGILVFDGSVVRGAIASNNAETGIDVGAGSTVEGCAARENDIGFTIGSHSSARGNAARANLGIGFNVGRGATLIGNTAADNGGDGFSLAFIGLSIADEGGLAKGNVALNNGGYGFDNGVFQGPLGPVIGTTWGLIDNIANDNNAGGDQIRGGIEMGQNVCQEDLVCP